ncbi:hypothetical protein Barb7_03080 [Bacteroidales bacterium Barb7]|nr:hypothetical protein Barb7_03080 [Bacteroidales bacterium Barb7]
MDSHKGDAVGLFRRVFVLIGQQGYFREEIGERGLL